MKDRTLVGNASWIIICRAIQTVLGFGVSLLTARYLGPSNYGLINYASSLVVFVAPIATLGLSNILVQELVNDPSNEGQILGTSMVTSLISSLFSIIGVAGFAYIANPGELVTTIVCILFSFSLFFQVLELMAYWFQSKLLSKYTAIVSLFSYTIISAFRIVLLASEKSVYWFAASYTLEHILTGMSILLIYRKLGGQNLSFSIKRARIMLSRSRYYIISGLMVTVFTQTDKVMLKTMLGVDSTGYYSVAYVIANLATFVFAAIIDSFRPIVLSNKNVNNELYSLNMIRLCNVITFLSIGVSIGLTAFAYPIVHVLYGETYVQSVGVLRLLVWCTTFSYLGVARNIWILAESKQRYLWIINLSGAVINIVLNFLLIPYMGTEGAALASLLTQFLTNIILGYIIAPLRGFNALMIKGLNFRLLLDFVHKRKG